MSRPQGFINSIGGFAIGKRNRLTGFSCIVRTIDYVALAGIRYAVDTRDRQFGGAASVMAKTKFWIADFSCSDTG